MAAARSQRVQFTLHCPVTHFGEHVRVVGSPAPFGAWVPHRSAVVLATSEADFPVWRSAWLELPEGLADFEYKYVVCRDGCEPRWEARPNRKMHVPKSGTEWLVSAGFDNLQPPAWRDVSASAPREGDHLAVVVVNVLQQKPRFGSEAHRQATAGAMKAALGWFDHQQDIARRCAISLMGASTPPTADQLMLAKAPSTDDTTDTAAAVFGATDELPAAKQFMLAKAPSTDDTTDTAAAVLGATDELPAADQLMLAKAPSTDDNTDTAAAVLGAADELPAAKQLMLAKAPSTDDTTDTAAAVFGATDEMPAAQQLMLAKTPSTDDTTDTAAAVLELPAAEQLMPAKATGVQGAPEDDSLSTADTFDDCDDDHSASEHEVDSAWEGSPKHTNLGAPRGFDEDDEPAHQDPKANSAHLACSGGGDTAGSRGSVLVGARWPLAPGALGAPRVDVWAAAAEFFLVLRYIFLVFIMLGCLARN